MCSSTRSGTHQADTTDQEDPLSGIRVSKCSTLGGLTRQTERMDAFAVVVLIVLLAVPLVIVGVMFVWAAIRDGEEDRAIQRRLGIRRKTRIGR